MDCSRSRRAGTVGLSEDSNHDSSIRFRLFCWMMGQSVRPQAMTPLREMVLLSAVALQFPDQSLMWGAPNLKVTNIPDANRCVRLPRRKKWQVKGL